MRLNRYGKRRHVDTAGHQNLPLLPAAGHQLPAVVQPEFFYRALSAIQGALSLHQRLLVPLRLVAEQGIPGHSLRSERCRDRAGTALRDPETFFLSAYFSPLSQVLKRELLYVPFFGWAMAMLRPIAIDRDNPKAALKHVAKKGDELLKDNVWVLIFPEGTRVPYGTIGKFSRGGTALAVNAELPVLPIAHNAGKFWPKTGWRKKQGVITVIIGAPMYAEGSGPRAIAELNDRVQAWNEQMQREMGSLPPAPQAPVTNDQVVV